MHRDSVFREYLTCYHGVTRYRLRQAWIEDNYADIGSSDDDYTVYANRTREGSQVEIAPILDRMVRGNSQLASIIPQLLFHAYEGLEHTTGYE